MNKPERQKQKIDILKGFDVFSDLKDAELLVLANYSEYEKHAKGANIFSPGEAANALYLVSHGEVVIHKIEEFPEGNETRIARFIEYSGFGELELFTQTPRNALAQCEEDTELLRFPGKDSSLEIFLEEQPEISAQILHQFIVVMARRIRRANELLKENSPVIQELRKQVYRDKLTGINNQEYLKEKLQELMKKDKPFTLLISKPDNFKDLNDQFGHEAGDKAIRLMARQIRKQIGDSQRVARFKGNAMAVILHSGDRLKARDEAEKLRHFIASLNLSKLTHTSSFHLTASVGIGLFPEHGNEPQAFLDRVHSLPLAGRNMGGSMTLFPEDGSEVE